MTRGLPALVCVLLAMTAACGKSDAEEPDPVPAPAPATTQERGESVMLPPAWDYPPSEATRRAAIGDVSELEPELRAAFSDGPEFTPMPMPQPGDWLSIHDEEGQTWGTFLTSGANQPTGRRTTIYLLPVGDFPEGAPEMSVLRDFVARFFQLPAKVLDRRTVEELGATTRTRKSGRTQVLSTDVLDWLEDNLPEDAYCLLAVTMEDLYPADSWNFVFGQARLYRRVGVFSFARHDPGFFGESARGEDWKEVLLHRSLGTVAHEIGHMFGISHCVYYACLMSGSNSDEESDRQPLHLCPMCLRKLHHAVGFDPSTRYRRLENFYDRVGPSDEAAWVRERAKALEAAEAQP